MHILKLKSNDIKNVAAEALREGPSKVGDIDPTKTYLNKNYAPEENICRTSEELKERISDLGVKRKIRGDAVLATSTVIDLPKDYEGDTDEFFQSAYKAFVDTMCHGDESRVVYAILHLDEDHPHMQAMAIPIIETDKGMKLSAKELVNDTFMKKFHPTMQDKISKDLGRPVNLYDPDKCEERAEAREKGDRSKDYVTLSEHKARKQKEAVNEQLKAENEGLLVTRSVLNAEVNKLSDEKDKTNTDLAMITREKIQMTSDLRKVNSQLLAAKNSGVAQLSEINDKIYEATQQYNTTIKRLKTAENQLSDIQSKIQQSGPIRDLLQRVGAFLVQEKKSSLLKDLLKRLSAEGYDQLYNEKTNEVIPLPLDDTIGTGKNDLSVIAEDLLTKAEDLGIGIEYDR